MSQVRTSRAGGQRPRPHDVPTARPRPAGQQAAAPRISNPPQPMLRLPKPLAAAYISAARRIRLREDLRRAGTLLAFLSLLTLAVLLVERLVLTGSGMRLLLVGLLLLSVISGLLWFALQRRRSRPDARAVALELNTAMPPARAELVRAAIELAADARAASLCSQRLLDIVQDQAAAACVGGLAPQPLLCPRTWRSLRAGGLGLLLLLAALAVPHLALGHAALRLAAPRSDHARIAPIHLDLPAPTWPVVVHEPLPVYLTTSGGRLPSAVDLLVRSGDGPPLRLPMRAIGGGLWSAIWTPGTTSATLQAVSQVSTSRLRPVEPLQRPRAVGVDLEIRPPEPLGLPTRRVQWRSETLRVPAGSTVLLRVRAAGRLAGALATDRSTGRLVSLQLRNGGEEVWGELSAGAEQTWDLTLLSQAHLPGTAPITLRIEHTPDQPPSVRRLAVAESAEGLTLIAELTDDHGLESADLVHVAEPQDRIPLWQHRQASQNQTQLRIEQPLGPQLALEQWELHVRDRGGQVSAGHRLPSPVPAESGRAEAAGLDPDSLAELLSRLQRGQRLADGLVSISYLPAPLAQGPTQDLRLLLGELHASLVRLAASGLIARDPRARSLHHIATTEIRLAQQQAPDLLKPGAPDRERAAAAIGLLCEQAAIALQQLAGGPAQAPGADHARPQTGPDTHPAVHTAQLLEHQLHLLQRLDQAAESATVASRLRWEALRTCAELLGQRFLDTLEQDEALQDLRTDLQLLPPQFHPARAALVELLQEAQSLPERVRVRFDTRRSRSQRSWIDGLQRLRFRTRELLAAATIIRAFGTVGIAGAGISPPGAPEPDPASVERLPASYHQEVLAYFEQLARWRDVEPESEAP